MVHLPSESALAAGREVSRRVSGRAATVRTAFLRSPDIDQPSPLRRMLVGGQGGAVRLKLYLSMHFIAVAPPHTTDRQARVWAELLDLPTHTPESIRRVREALKWLERNQFVRVVPRPGDSPLVYMLADDGSGAPFTRVTGASDIWVKIPAELWSGGWIAVLSGRALAILLVLFDYANLRKQDGPFWIHPDRSKELYGLSQETWTRGANELESYGLLTTDMEYVSDGSFGVWRRRKLFTILRARLAHPPAAGP